MQTNEPAGVTVLGIVMRPVENRRLSGIVDYFAPYFDPVARMNRDAWRDIDVVDDLNGASGRIERELFVLALRMAPEEETRFGHNGSGQIGHTHLLRAPITPASREGKP
jgi:hypothetical protein